MMDLARLQAGRQIISLVCCAWVVLVAGCAVVKRQASPTNAASGALQLSEFIYDRAPFPSCHASTIEDTGSGLVAAWFGGTDEGNDDVGIWVSRHDRTRWSAPVEVATGRQSDGKRHPTWNPVLFQPKTGPLLLFYKVGPTPSKWWGMLITSTDGGKSWSAPRRLPDGILGPIKNKAVLLWEGSLLCPSSTEHDGWTVHMERTADLGANWTKTAPLNDGKEFGAIQPTVLFHPENRLQILCRSRQKVITECWSEDGGKTWGPMKATALPNPNSGIDAVTLKDGRHLLVHNPVARGRSPLIVSVSANGRTWSPVVTLESEPGEYSYPAIIQGRDGKVHITYTWKRQRIRHAVLDPNKVSASAGL
jgi:predicted neuraminidase